MDDIKSKLSGLEDQVSAIKDPVLRKIAFEKLLEHSLGGTVERKSSKHTKGIKHSIKKRKASSPFYSEAKIRDSVKRINVTGSLAGFPPFKTCKSKIDSYLWVLAFAKHNKIRELNNHEIAYILTKKLYKITKYSTVYGIHKKVKESLVMLDPDSESWVITPDGENHLKTLKNS